MPRKKAENKDTPKKPVDFFKKIKTGNVLADSHKKIITKSYIDTGSYVLNAMFSGDMTVGFQDNRIHMLAEKQSAGKTLFFMYCFCKPMYDLGYHIYWIDSENAVTHEDFEGFGIDADRVTIIKESVVEKVTERVNKIVLQIEAAREAGKDNVHKCMFVLDSQGQLDTEKSRADVTSGKGVKDMTKQQKLRAMYNNFTQRIGDLDIPFCVTNWLYENIGGYGEKKKVAGGHAGLYAASNIFLLTNLKAIESEKHTGTIFRIKIYKSRTCRLAKEANIYLDFSKGLNKWYGLHTFADEAGLIDTCKKVEEVEKKYPKITVPKLGAGDKYVLKHPDKDESEWIVCNKKTLHSKEGIGFLFDPINEWVGKNFKLLKPVDFDYEEDLDIDDSNLTEKNDDTIENVTVEEKEEETASEV